MKLPSVLIGEDHRLVAEGIGHLLEPSYTVAGMAADGLKLIEAAKDLQPDLILVDISMPVMSGLSAAPRLREVAPAAKLVFLSMHAEPAYALEAFRLGASGYVAKVCAATELHFALEEALAGRSYTTPSILFDAERAERDELSPRQRDVLRLIAEGHSLKSIGDILNISSRTVEFHKVKIKHRLGFANNAELVRYALAHHLLL